MKLLFKVYKSKKLRNNMYWSCFQEYTRLRWKTIGPEEHTQLSKNYQFGFKKMCTNNGSKSTTGNKLRPRICKIKIITDNKILFKNSSIYGQHTKGTETHKILDEANNTQWSLFLRINSTVAKTTTLNSFNNI